MMTDAQREAQRARARRYYERNKQRVIAAATTWKRANPEKVRASAKIYRDANTDRQRELVTAWEKRNPDRVKAKSKRYYDRHAFKVRAKSVAYHHQNKDELNARAREYKAQPSYKAKDHTYRERREHGLNTGSLSTNIVARLHKAQRGLCVCCRLALGNDYHLDHIMPLALGGKNTDDNVQLLRRVCNLNKHAKHPVDFMQERGFLL